MDETIRDALRRSLGTPARRWLLVGTLVIGLLAAVALVAAADPADRTFAELSDTVQSLTSVATPLFGILLVRDLRRAPVRPRWCPQCSRWGCRRSSSAWSVS